MVAKRVGFDVDGVWADFTRAYSGHAVRMGIPNARVIDVSEVNCWDWPTEQFGWPEGSDDKVWSDILRTPNWWMTLSPMVKRPAFANLRRLMNSADVFFITNRPDTAGFTAQTQTRLWFESMGVDMDGVTVLATKKKGPLAGALELDAFIDDNLGNLNDVSDQGIFTVALSAGYNQQWGGPRVNHVSEFIEMMTRD